MNRTPTRHAAPQAPSPSRDGWDGDRGHVERRRFGVCRAFVEIQAGPNPLTADEVTRLAALRPQYAALRPPFRAK
jgi:hypothetical protein